MSDPLVSIVIPCYRHGGLLAEAIESALSQSLATTAVIEVIVVDDGSDDDTAAVAERYGARIRYLRQENRGLGSARNLGVRTARGRYLHFLDADDRLEPEALAWATARLAGREDTVCLFGFRFLGAGLTAEESEPCLPSASFEQFHQQFAHDPLLAVAPERPVAGTFELLPYLLYTTFGPPHCWVASRRQVVAVGLFDESLRACEDWDLWLRLALAGTRLATTDEVGALYRRLPGSMSSDKVRMLENRARVLLKACAAIEADRELAANWSVHALQATRRARRRFAAHSVDSPLVGELTKRIARFDRQLGSKGTASSPRRFLERILGGRLDRLALAYYRRFRAELAARYESEIN